MLNLVSFKLHNVSPVDNTGEIVPEDNSELFTSTVEPTGETGEDASEANSESFSEISSDDPKEEESTSALPEEEITSEIQEEESNSEVDSSEYTSQVVVDNQVSSYSPQLDTLIGVGLFLIVIVLSFMIYKELCKLFDC